MSMIEPPAALSRAEKRAFRRVAASMTELGLSPADRVDLLVDFVRTDARLEALRAEEAAASGPEMIRASRAVNVASAERRRLHAALFAGGHRAKPDAVEVVRTAEFAGPSEADEAWRDHHYGRERGLPQPAHPWSASERAAYDAEGKAIQAKYGRPTWRALLYPTHAAWIEGQRQIAKYNRRHRSAGSSTNGSWS